MDLDAVSGTECALLAHRYRPDFYDLCQNNDMRQLIHHIDIRWEAFSKCHYILYSYDSVDETSGVT